MSIKTYFDEAKLSWARQGGNHVVNVVRAHYLTGQALARRTGTLVRSIKDEVLPTGDGFKFGTNVRYGIGWELGFRLPERTIVPVKRKALKFTVAGKTIFARKVVQPARTVAARPFLWPGLTESVPYLQGLADRLFSGAAVKSFPNRVIRVVA